LPLESISELQLIINKRRKKDGKRQSNRKVETDLSLFAIEHEEYDKPAEHSTQ